MTYWLKRKIEAAIAAHLSTVVSGDMRVYRSSDLTPRQLPCAVVRCHTLRRFPGQQHAAQRASVSVVVMVEYAHVVDGQASPVDKFEEIEERAVSSCLEALLMQDGELATALNATQTAGISFSYAAVGARGDDSVIADTTEDGNQSLAEIPLEVIAGAVEE